MKVIAYWLICAIMGLVMFIFGSISSNTEHTAHEVQTDKTLHHLQTTKLVALETQSDRIRDLQKDPRNMFVCQYAERLERVVEGYRDAQIATEEQAIVRDRGLPAETMHREFLKIAESDKRDLASLRQHTCLDITRLIEKP